MSYHICHSACEEDHNFEKNHQSCAEDCDCIDCHMDWHDPMTDWAICSPCRTQRNLEIRQETGI